MKTHEIVYIVLLIIYSFLLIIFGDNTQGAIGVTIILISNNYMRLILIEDKLEKTKE